MTNSADPDQSASSEATWSGSTLFAKAVYPGSAGQGLRKNYIKSKIQAKTVWNKV